MGSGKKCRSLSRRNDGALNDIKDFIFAGIPDSAHYHYQATLANYLGYPLVLGGSPGNNKLEILSTMGSLPVWIEYEGTDYPYSAT